MSVTEGAGAQALVPLDLSWLQCNATAQDVAANIRSSTARGLPRMNGGLEHGGRLLICGGGPSLKDNLDSLRAARDGATLWAVNAAHDFLIDNGIVPDGCVLLDFLPCVADMVTPHPGVTYYVASQCDPSVFDRLAGHQVRLWHAWNGDIVHDVVAECDAGAAVVHGGSTAALRCFHLGYWIGFRSFAGYGLDSSRSEAGTHAYGGGIWPLGDMDVTFAGRTFITNPSFALQARDFGLIWNLLAPTCRIEMVGDGLIPWMAKVFNAERRLAAAV